MLFICYPKCTTCQKAEKWLNNKGLSYTKRDIKVDNPTYDELKTWFEKSGLDIKKFFNTSGLLYKSMNLKDKLASMNEEEKLKLLSSNGMLVKRPIVITDNNVLVGFREKEWEQNL